MSRNQQTIEANPDSFLSEEEIASKILECENIFEEQIHDEPQFDRAVLPDEWLCNVAWVANDGVPMSPNQAMTTFT